VLLGLTAQLPQEFEEVLISTSTIYLLVNPTIAHARLDSSSRLDVPLTCPDALDACSFIMFDLIIIHHIAFLLRFQSFALVYSIFLSHPLAFTNARAELVSPQGKFKL
jgi:hypothetical protein